MLSSIEESMKNAPPKGDDNVEKEHRNEKIYKNESKKQKEENQTIV